MENYRAFISYSHSGDAQLAAALQRALERIAKPWFRRSSFKIFRDQTSLSASPGLWADLQGHLARCEYFILMASVGAASSRWVNQEVEWWLAHRPLARLLIVVTDGQIARSSDGSDFDWARTTCLPVALHGRFHDEPLWVDMRPPKEGERLSPKSARFRDAVLTLAAPLHGRSKDELDSADIREHQRVMLVGALALTAVIASTGSALWMFANARHEAERADGNWREAQSRRLATMAMSTLRDERNINEAIQLAVLAWRLDPTAESQAALREMERASADVARILGHHTGRVEALAFSQDSSQLASMSEDGSILIWKTARLEAEPRVLAGRLDGRSWYRLRFDANGRRLRVWNSKGAAEVWDLASGERSTELPARSEQVSGMDFNHDGTLAAFIADRQLAVWDLVQHKTLPVPSRLRGATMLAVHFTPDGSLLVMERLEDSFRATAWNPGSGSVTFGRATQRDYDLSGAYVFGCFAPSGRVLALALDGKFSFWRIAPDLGLQRFVLPRASPSDYDQRLACSVDDTSVLIAADKRWEQWKIGNSWTLHASGEISGNEATWSADQRWLATALKDKIVVTELGADPKGSATVSLNARCRPSDYEGDDTCWRSLCEKIAPTLTENKLRSLFGIRDYEVFYDNFKSRIDASLCDTR